MYNTVIMLLISLMVQGCSDYFSKSGTDSKYFSDASTCYQSSVRKEQLKVPTAGTMSIIEIPTGNDAGAFSNCMAYKGHPIEKADPEAYLNASRECLQATGNATDPGNAYADCIKHGNITVETLPNGKANEE
ncbi:MAG: hypothetical protein PHR16_07665 [Methylovulum sp.]|nr:hypothetical protein [Methylovulum sp.]